MRTLKMRRIYSLGNYQSLELTDEFEIPEGLELETELVSKIQILQMLNMEAKYRDYLALQNKLHNDPESVFQFLEETYTHTLDSVKQLLNNKGE